MKPGFFSDLEYCSGHVLSKTNSVTPIFWGGGRGWGRGPGKFKKNCVRKSILGAKVLKSQITLAELLNGETVNQINKSNKSSGGFWGEGKTGVPGKNLQTKFASI